jgi:hypothetical protein
MLDDPRFIPGDPKERHGMPVDAIRMFGCRAVFDDSTFERIVVQGKATLPLSRSSMYMWEEMGCLVSTRRSSISSRKNDLGLHMCVRSVDQAGRYNARDRIEHTSPAASQSRSQCCPAPPLPLPTTSPPPENSSPYSKNYPYAPYPTPPSPLPPSRMPACPTTSKTPASSPRP